jgi:phage shock protein C
MVRPRTGRKLAGVCAGVAGYLGLDPAVVRLAWVVLSVVPGMVVGGLALYIVSWVLMPEADSANHEAGATRRLMRSTANRRIAGVCGGIADYCGVDATPLRLVWIILSVVPGAIVGGLLAYVIAWAVIPKGTSVAQIVPARPAAA